MDWKATIERADNGYIVRTQDEDAEGAPMVNTMVFNEKDPQDETNNDHLLDALSEIINYFGESGSRYDKRRIHLCYQIGDKFEGKKEEACKGVDYGVLLE